MAEIVEGEGFRLNTRKSRLTTRAGRQSVTGIVVNENPNPSRRDYDALRAMLHDAMLRGPAHANRQSVPDFRAHLLGRIGWFEQLNPARGAKLRRTFAEIEWSPRPGPLVPWARPALRSAWYRVSIPARM